MEATIVPGLRAPENLGHHSPSQFSILRLSDAKTLAFPLLWPILFPSPCLMCSHTHTFQGCFILIKFYCREGFMLMVLSPDAVLVLPSMIVPATSPTLEITALNLVFHFLLTCFILIPPPPSPSYLPCLIPFPFLPILIHSHLCPDRPELLNHSIWRGGRGGGRRGETGRRRDMRWYEWFWLTQILVPQSRPVILPGSVGLKEAMEGEEEDTWNLPGETFDLLTTFLWV